MLEPRLGLSLAAVLGLAACTSPDLGEAKDHGGDDGIHQSGYGVHVGKEKQATALPKEADATSTALAGNEQAGTPAPPARPWPKRIVSSTAEKGAAAPTPAGPAGELVTKDEVVGTGPAAKKGDEVRVHYTGRLTNGVEFDSSVKRNRPFEFVLGQGRVIKGWDVGVVGMKPGGKRKLIVPPDMGYGARDAGKIPPNSTLEFDVELLEIIPPLPAAQGPEAFASTLRTFKTPGKVAVAVHKEGQGDEAKPGDVVEVHYTGTIKSDGSEFDSSVKRGQPIKFPVGTGRVIKGWDEAIVGMKVGEVRTITIPPEMGYAERARPKIPANSTLVFQVEMMRITAGAPVPAAPKPGGARPPGAKPAGAKPPGAKPAGAKPPGAKPAGAKPPGGKPAGGKPAGGKPAGQ